MFKKGLCVVLVGCLLGFAARWGAIAKYRLASEINPSHADYYKVICGPMSLSCAMARLGVNATAAQVAKTCRVTPYGVSLIDLADFAGGQSTIANTITELSWDDLRNINGVAVLFVNGDHYICVDPRVDNSDGSLRVYDGDAPARWCSRTELERIWTGKALVLEKRRPATPSDRPQLEWDECYIDHGLIPQGEAPVYAFEFHNRGCQDLIVQDIKVSCGCTKPTLSQKRVAPGETARIEVSLNLEGREGRVQQSVFVETNDPIIPISLLRVACATPRRRAISTEAMRFDDISRGGQLKQQFIVAAPGFEGIEVRNANFNLEGNAISDRDLSCSISWKPIRAATKMLSSRLGFAATPGDYLIEVAFEARNNCPIETFRGELVITVDSNAVPATHRVSIEGSVVQDAYAAPQVALITLGPGPNDGGAAEIRLRSRTHKRIQVNRINTGGVHALQIALKKGTGEREATYVVSTRLPKILPGDVPVSGEVVFELEGNSRVTVPVTIFRAPAIKLPEDRSNGSQAQ
ncbi:DUF1573 domain-containing protein [Lacipirellula parvula]|uniref:Peptidase C39 domain-containing protein n=1 Tax=Lacipirellula parvula TaxID=2650471 RepID=A0A5K7XHP9_9BACT|nr:DUF1573 domain-containing protein [Lacipirellula parvula]BBO35572.1 hypothetical protein PLANPX_5184 [Lacipirellula parvula]